MKALSLRDTPAISEDVSKSLKKVPDLSQLNSGENRQFTDQALTHIAELKKLTLLALGSTDISDAGLKHLPAHEGLRRLSLNGTGITAQGVAELREALSEECQIDWEKQPDRDRTNRSK